MSIGLKYENIVKTVNEFCSIGESRGLSHQYTQDKKLNGREITINNKRLIHFGSCSYMGLELDERLKEAAIEAIKNFGSLFACSRIFVSSTDYLELEDLLAQMFGNPILLTQNTSLGHYAVMPIVIGSNDMVIYDQQAHFSMQDLSYKLSHNGSGIDVLRHNRFDELEERIKKYKEKYDKIWYVIDGVYSMFGDTAPIKDIINLLDKHKKLHLYVDDAHGIGWAGPNGSGYTFSQTKLHPKMILGTSLAKGFGSCGGLFVFNNKELRDKVRKWGGPLSHSGPQEPATIATTIASAKIHLSQEIYDIQKSLQKKIAFCNEVMTQYKVPLVYNSPSPIFFVGCGLTRVGFNMVERLMDEGFYTNIGIFPAVPESCTGVRFTITNHIEFDTIERLAKTIAQNLPKALKEEDRGMKDIYRAFRKFTNFEERFGAPDNSPTQDLMKTEDNKITIKVHNSINEINGHLWDKLLGHEGHFTWENLKMLEEVFSNNEKAEDNWKFIYYLVYHKEKLVIASFFTISLSKDDMLANDKISQKIEALRKDNPYHLTSKTMMTGSPITNGNHLYIDKKNPVWEKALMQLIDDVWQVKDKEQVNSLFFRDLEKSETELHDFFINQGFFNIDMLSSNVINGIKNLSFEEFFLKTLNSSQRKSIKKEALNGLELFEIKIEKQTESDLKTLYNLYQNVKNTNLELNTFPLPYKFFEHVNKSDNWEIIIVRFNNEIAAGILAYRGKNSYSPVVLGMNYDVNSTHKLYKKVLLIIIKRAFELKKEQVFLGVTGDETKRKFGAKQIEQVAYVQIKDKYNQELIDSMSFQ